jgi:hypothetical protein
VAAEAGVNVQTLRCYEKIGELDAKLMELHAMATLVADRGSADGRDA